MQTENNPSSQDELWRRFHHRHDEEKEPRERDRFFKLRQCLNFIFIIATVFGVATWFTQSREMGTYILILGIVFKFAEASLRIVKI
jgi:hypothetical protein